MTNGAISGMMLALAWAVLIVVSSLVFNDSEGTPTAQMAPPMIQPYVEREQLRIDPQGKAEDGKEEKSGDTWRRRRTAFA